MARKKNKFAFAVGVIAIILAVIGLITVIRFGINAVNNQKNKAAEKAEYEEFLRPVVMFDPDPFDDLTQADNSQLMYAAVWSLLLDENGADKYSYSTGETVGIVVPQADLEKAFVKLFGNEIDVKNLHSSIDMSTYDITYDSALKSYILPITGVDSAYISRVTDITKQGSSRVLTVEYIGSKAWAEVKNGEFSQPEADKIMTITLRKGNSGMYVSSIQTTNRNEFATSQTESYSGDYREEEAEELYEDEITGELTSEENTEFFETVTDENGEAVTDENGETVTVISGAVSDISEIQSEAVVGV